MPHWNNQPWQRNLSKIASDKPGAVHFRVEGRRTWFETIEEMQAVLDDYLEDYNTKRLHQGRGMNGRTPIRAFTEGMPKTSNTEVTSQTKTAELKAA
jgi:transposase InsO family protein